MNTGSATTARRPARWLAALVLLALGAGGLAACTNTVEGLGEDLGIASDALSGDDNASE